MELTFQTNCTGIDWQKFPAILKAVYILHQTIIVIIAYFIYNKDLNVGIKFAILVIATLGISFLIFEIVKRFWLTRILFGIKNIK